jgi:hypothetical protein
MSEPAVEVSGQPHDYPAAYEARHRLHLRNSMIYMGSLFGTGAAVILLFFITMIDSFLFADSVDPVRNVQDAIHYRKRVRYETPGWVAPAQLGLGVLAVGMGAFVVVCKRVFPIPLLCPKCDVRLDEIGLFDGCCPQCKTKLR